MKTKNSTKKNSLLVSKQKLKNYSPVSCWNSGISSAIVSSGLYLRLVIIAQPELEQPDAELCDAAAALLAARQMSSNSAATSSTPRTRRRTFKASCFLPRAARELGVSGRRRPPRVRTTAGTVLS